MEESYQVTTSTTNNKFILLLNKVLKTLLSIIVLLLVWDLFALLVERIFNHSDFLPNVHTTLKSVLIIITKKGFIKTILTSFYRVIVGLTVGIILGALLATLCHYSRIADALLSPVISIMKATPVACIIVLLWISMSNSQLTIFVVVTMVMPIIWQNVLEGYRVINKDLSEVADIFEFSRSKRFRFLIFPTLLKYLIPAIISAIGMAWKSEVATEIITYNNMGGLIYDFKSNYDTAFVFGWTVIIIVLSISFESFAKHLLRRIKI